MFPTKNKSINRWAAIMVLAFMLLFSIVFGRFVYLAKAQEVDNHDLVKLGDKKWTKYKILDSSRGTIFDSNGRTLARDVPAYTLYAVISPKAPKYVKDKERTAEELAPILDLSKSDILNRLNNEGAYQVQFGGHGNNLSYNTMKKIQDLNIPGIDFIPSMKRYYPNQDFASHLIGFTTYSNKTGKQVGRLGLEDSLNKYLTEEDGTVSFYSDVKGLQMPDSNEKVNPPKDGDNVYLTLDYKIQTALDEAMSKVDAKYKPKKMIGLVADPKTGKILAMSDRPSFNPNKRDVTNYTNFAISAPYEPGSTMKMFTLAAAVNEGVWPGDQTYQSGSYHVPGVTIHDYNRSWGRISFNEGLQRSSNVAFSIVADKKLGTDKLFEYLYKFGFNKKTGIDLPDESNSLLATNYQADKVSTAFGQASAVTAIQLVQAATAIANDGKMMKPYVIDKIVDPNTNKVVLQNKPKMAGTPITKDTSKKVRDLLRTVVNGKHGTGTLFDLKGYDVIGKTGTAQIPGKGGYLPHQYVHSFLGMAPQDDPKLIVYVAIDRPDLTNTPQSAKPVAEVFDPVMKNGLQYLNITPNEEKSPSTVHSIKLDDFSGDSLQKAASTLKADGLDVVTVGSQIVQSQFPLSGDEVLPGSKVILLGKGPYQVPDLTGWSLADGIKLARLLNVKVDSIGSGYVIKQKPASGLKIKSGDHLYIELSDPSQTQENVSDPSSETTKNDEEKSKSIN